MTDPMTGEDIFYTDDYDASAEDDVHTCEDKKPSASINNITSTTGEPRKVTTDEVDEEGNPVVKIVPGTTTYKITASASFGRYKLESYELQVNGKTVKSGEMPDSGGQIEFETTTKPTSVTFTVRDAAGYTTTATGGTN